jgi:hypothetical protein
MSLGFEPAESRATRWLSAISDDAVLRWTLRLLIAATVAVLALDFAEMAERVPAPAVAAPGVSPQPLPAARPGEREAPAGPEVRKDKLAAAMTFELAADGRLIASGTIKPGTAAAFAAEIEKRGAYVKTVVLQSPGGSVQDALAMGRLIRERKFNTAVEARQYCASSCPLVFAGGVERRAGAQAAIGVHQVFAAAASSGATLADGMDDAQRISAECQRYLREMGTDLQVWVHAMETPKHRLFYFRPDELLALKLATEAAGAKPAIPERAAKNG